MAFRSELPEGLSPAYIGSRRLALLREGAAVRAFEADCPHRGANLAEGGRLRGCAIECPFHGYLISLDQQSRARFRAEEYRVLIADDLIFVRLSQEKDNAFEAILDELRERHSLVPALHMEVRASMALVIENAFDRLHFTAVHGIRTERFDVRRTRAGSVRVTSTFHVPRVATKRGGARRLLTDRISYRADIISPGIAIVQLGADPPYGAITGAVTEPSGRTHVRLAFALDKATFGDAPKAPAYEQLLAQSRRGLEQDQRVWENIAVDHDPSFTTDDKPIHHFATFCREFE